MNIMEDMNKDLMKTNLIFSNKNDRIIASKMLLERAGNEVITGKWNVFVCDKFHCDWNFPDCSNLYLVITCQDYFLNVFQWRNEY